MILARILCQMRVPPPTEEFTAAIAALGVELEQPDLDRLAHYLEVLYETNEFLNLTRVPPELAWTRHILDSLTLVPDLAALGASSVLDLGSGGGLPGLVLAIVLPSIVPTAHVTLLEATTKKARFLESTAALVAPGVVTVINERAERAAHDRERLREHFDAVVSRAVGAMSVLAELALPFVRQGGFLLAIKGERAEQELEEASHAIGVLGAKIGESSTTPTGTLVRLLKVSRTPRIYPRASGEPARCPLQPRRAR